MYIKNPSQDYHSKIGVITKEELKKENITKNGEEFAIFEATFIDNYLKMKRTAQIITLKDIGAIITYTGIGADSVIIDCGSGSGGNACFLANLAKKVYTYDNNKEHLKCVQENIKNLGLNNIEVIERDVYIDGFDKKNADVLILDIKEPWFCLEHAAKALKRGGYLVSYSPNITQTSELINENDRIDKTKNFIHEKTIEIIEREWIVEEKKARPSFARLGHTGFLTFMRRY